MATSLVIEEEQGVYCGSPRHPHNGYWAGDFSNLPSTQCGPVPPVHLVWSTVTTVMPKPLRPVAGRVLPDARHSRRSSESVAAA